MNQQSSIHPNPPETQSVRSPEPPQGGLGDRLLSSNSCISSQRRGQTGRRPKQRKPSKAQERCARNESGTLPTRHTHRGTRAAGSERRRTRTRRRKRAERRRDPQSAAALARRAQASGRRRRYKKASCSPEVRLATYLGNIENGSGACIRRVHHPGQKLSGENLTDGTVLTMRKHQHSGRTGSRKTGRGHLYHAPTRYETLDSHGGADRWCIFLSV